MEALHISFSQRMTYFVSEMISILFIYFDFIIDNLFIAFLYIHIVIISLSVVILEKFERLVDVFVEYIIRDATVKIYNCQIRQEDSVSLCNIMINLCFHYLSSFACIFYILALLHRTHPYLLFSYLYITLQPTLNSIHCLMFPLYVLICRNGVT